MTRGGLSSAWFALFAVLTCAPCGLAHAERTEAPAAAPARDWVRGVTVSCRRYGPGEWDGPDMSPHVERLARDMGANWVSTHPYARIHGDGSITFRDNPRVTAKAVEFSHAHGVKVMIKPHLAYWGSPFDWRGDIGFGDDEAAWRRFFDGYVRWIAYEARAAQAAGADAFCIGLEYRKSLHREADWRRVIAAVRAEFTGPITYGAHWEDVARVPFWDALDVIGVCFYAPVAAGANPSEAELREIWAKHRKWLADFSAEHGKPIVLAELGYARSVEAGMRPYDDRFVGPADQAEAVKALCLEVALDEMRREPSVVGVFLWKTFPRSTRTAGEFLVQGPGLSAAVARGWGALEDASAQQPRPVGGDG